MNRSTTALCIGLLLGATAFGQAISVNFAGDAAGTLTNFTTPADVAGVYAVANWNGDETLAQTGSLSSLIDSNGNATGASVTWGGSNNVWGGSGATTADERMVNGWLDDNGTGALVEFSGVPYSDYDVYVYGSSDAPGNAGNGFNTQVNGTTFFSGGEFTTGSANGSFFNGTYVNGATTDADPTFHKVTDISPIPSAGSATLTVLGANNGAGPALPGGGTRYRGGISGIQVVDTYGLGTGSASRVINPSDPVFGGQVIGDQFVVGDEGFTIPGNNWPGGEPPQAATDGEGQKYLNFGKENSGIVVNPASDEVVNGIKLWAANDAVERDPASYQLWGTNATSAIDAGGPLLVPGSVIPLSAFTLISEGGLALPETRNAGGGAALEEANSQLVVFANDTPYDTYMVVFPTVKDSAAANSMQIAEIQLTTGTVPEPSALGLMGLALCGLLGLRRLVQ